MYVYKFNDHTNRYYYYKYDEFSSYVKTPLLDDKLHDNTKDPVTLLSNVCCYCGCNFVSRNKLFNHLGFMNIDIKRSTGISEYNDEMGDFGMTLEKGVPKKKRKAHPLRNKNKSKRRCIEQLASLRLF